MTVWRVSPLQADFEASPVSLKNADLERQRSRLDFSLRAQVIDALAHDLAEITRVEPIRDLNPFSAQLGELLIERIQARADARILLQILPACEDIVVDLFDALAQPAAFLAERLAQVIDVSLDNLLLDWADLFGDLALHILQSLE